MDLILGDCIENMKSIPDGSIDMVLTDPPYNIGKAEWDKIDNYIEWMGKCYVEFQRVLKDTGSLYWFHNDMEQISQLMNWMGRNTKFIFKQFIVWNKKFEGAGNEGFLQGFIEPGTLRNYQKMAEYCLFYTFQDEKGLTKVKTDLNNFKLLRQHFKEFQQALGLTKKEIMDKIGQCADHPFRWGSSQWDMPTEETYRNICELPVEYEFVRKEYEDLRKEYEDLRYTFNNQKTHHSVWNYSIEKKMGHITTKPLEMIENIILHSSNSGDVILDCFMGSGTTGVACKNLNRKFIGIEKDEKYFEIAKNRINGS